MKHWSFYIWLMISLGAYSQEKFMQIDSIPKEGILLNKGWKFHAGDNPDFAKPDFDDTQWESIDPTKDVMDLPQISQKGQIGWFRLRIKVDTSLTNTAFGAIVNQIGASEIYINGQLLIKFGKISAKANEIKAYNPSSPNKNYYIYSQFGENKEVVIAVRYALQPDIFYLKTFDRPNRILSINLKSVKRLNENNVENIGYDSSLSDYFRIGVFLILGLLHLLIYGYKRKQKVYLLISFYYIFGNCFFLTNLILYEYTNSVQIRMYLTIILYFIEFLWNISILITAYSLFQFRKSSVYWQVAIFYLPYFIYFFWDYNLSGKLAILLSQVFNILVAIVTILAIIKKRKGAWLLMIGISCSILINIILTVTHIFSDLSLAKIVILNNIVYSLNFLLFPICVIIIIARDFANTSNSLELKLAEVKHLSQEKQNTLLKQNAELQVALLKGQTIERQRVALDLHDNLGSTLSALWLSLDSVNQTNMNLEEKAIHQNLRENLEKAYNDVRLLSYNLLPEEFEKHGLTIILQGFVRKMNKNSTIKFDLEIDEDFGRVDNKIEFELYSICLELVNNIMKHSKASEAKIELSRSEKQIQLIVSDNGIGTFNNESDGKGMKNVKARVESLNGVWDLASKENEGTYSTINIPI